jgi:hypothetical protein
MNEATRMAYVRAHLSWTPTAIKAEAAGITPEWVEKYVADPRPEFDGEPIVFRTRAAKYGAPSLLAVTLYVCKILEMYMYSLKFPDPWPVAVLIDHYRKISDPYFWYRCRAINGEQMIRLYDRLMDPDQAPNPQDMPLFSDKRDHLIRRSRALMPLKFPAPPPPRRAYSLPLLLLDHTQAD